MYEQMDDVQTLNYRDGSSEDIQFILLHPKFPKQELPKSCAKA